MKLTELLITGYDGDKVILATDLTAEKAASVLAATSLSDGTTVEADAALAEVAFKLFVKTLERLTLAKTGDASNELASPIGGGANRR